MPHRRSPRNRGVQLRRPVGTRTSVLKQTSNKSRHGLLTPTSESQPGKFGYPQRSWTPIPALDRPPSTRRSPASSLQFAPETTPSSGPCSKASPKKRTPSPLSSCCGNSSTRTWATNHAHSTRQRTRRPGSERHVRPTGTTRRGFTLRAKGHHGRRLPPPMSKGCPSGPRAVPGASATESGRPLPGRAAVRVAAVAGGVVPRCRHRRSGQGWHCQLPPEVRS